jgi:molybdenum cofactor guanylyltransferase
MYLCSGVILTGGASRRMGRNKAWIELGGRTLIERVLDRLGQICQETILVTGDPESYGKLETRVVGDTFPGKGSLGGIYTGLSAAQHQRAIVVACDMPFLNRNLLSYMLSVGPDFDVVIPSAPSTRRPDALSPQDSMPSGSARPTAKDNDLHPLHAVYSKQCLGPIRTRIAEGDLRMVGFYPDVRVRVVTSSEVERWDPEHLSMFNVNTPEDLALAKSLAATEQTSNYDKC